MTCFRPRMVLLGVSTTGDVIWGKYSPKRVVNRQFQAKTPKSYIAISPELFIRRSSDLRTEFIPRKALREWCAITPKQIQHGWWPPSWKSIWRHISAADVPILDKIRQPGAEWHADYGEMVEVKPEVEFQYGGRLYFETGSCYISAANWDMSTKFGLLIDFDLLKAMTSIIIITDMYTAFRFDTETLGAAQED